MGKHENLNSSEKIQGQNELGECKSAPRHDNQQTSTLNLETSNDLARNNLKKEKEIINKSHNSDHDNHEDKHLTPHINTNGKKKKRRNKTKSKHNFKLKANSEINGLEEGVNELSDHPDNEVKSKHNSNEVPHVPDITTPSSNYKASFETHDKQPKLATMPHLLDANNELYPPIGKEKSQISNLSPRKQTILRYKKSDDRMNEGSFINEAKDNLKNKKNFKTPEAQHNKIDEAVMSPQTELDMDKKVSLFKYKYSRILVFDEQLDNTKADIDKSSSGRLLGHGEFEIFQLHNGDVTYLSCGPSFVYPLLPKLKILRISFNQFILPLVNPERYWRIYINSEDKNVIGLLVSTLEKNVKYRNLFFGDNQLHQANGSDIIGQKTPRKTSISAKNKEISKKEKSDSDDSEIKLKLNTDSKSSDLLHKDTSKFQFPVIFNDIPDSPPSAPLSPHNEEISNVNLLTPTKNSHLLPGWSIKQKPTEKSILNAMASLNVTTHKEPALSISHHSQNNLPTTFASDHPISSFSVNQNIRHPKPKRHKDVLNHSNTFQGKPSFANKPQDSKSDSSMDSLLDEYEENIVTTKSINFNSRPPSRPMSVVSSFSRPQINYTRGSYFHGPIERDPDETVNSHYNENCDELEFPTTSLSEYNKVRNAGNNSLFAKSRRSSRSELYTSESNWMEPNTTAIESGSSRIPRSRNSTHENGSDINNNVKQIYRSFTQRNLSHYTNDLNSNADSKSVKLHTHKLQPTFNPVKIRSPTMGTLHRKGSYANSVISGRTGFESMTRYSSINELPISHSKSVRTDLDQQRLKNYKVKLNSSEVYKMISESRSNKNLNATISGSRDNTSSDTKGKPQASGGFASRIFGW